jgi:hypothetical protein
MFTQVNIQLNAATGIPFSTSSSNTIAQSPACDLKAQASAQPD